MSETSTPIGEMLRGYTEGLDAHFDKAIADQKREVAYDYVERLFAEIQEDKESSWIARAAERFEEWDDKVIRPVRDALGSAQDIDVNEYGVEFVIRTPIPLETARPNVLLKLKFPSTTDQLHLAHGDVWRANNRMMPTREGGDHLWRPEQWQRDMAIRVGSTALIGRNRFGVKRHGFSISEVRQAATQRLREVSSTEVFQGVHYEIRNTCGSRRDHALAEGGVMNVARGARYSYLYDVISPFQHPHDLVAKTLEAFDEEAYAVVPEGSFDARIRSSLNASIRHKSKQIEKKYEFTDKVLELILRSSFYKDLAAYDRTKVTEL